MQTRCSEQTQNNKSCQSAAAMFKVQELHRAQNKIMFAAEHILFIMQHQHKMHFRSV